MSAPGHEQAARRVRGPGGPGRLALTIAPWAAGVLVLLAVLVGAGAFWLDTGAGHRFIGTRLAALDMSGVSLRVGRIDGSIYRRMVLRGVVARDRNGVVATSPAVVLDWDPPALLRRHVLVNELSSQQVRLVRQPLLKSGKGKSNMPSLSYTLKRFAVSELVLEPALTGERRSVSVLASADMAHGRTLLDATARTLGAAGGAGGDVARVRLDALPRANRLQIAAHVAGPKGGVVDRLLKLGAPVALDVGGRGDWADWRGRARAAVGGAPVLDAALRAQNGRFSAAGSARPGQVVKSLEKLTSPVLRFDLAATVQGPRVGLDGRLASDQFSARIAGAVDRRRRILDKVQADAALLEPAALAPKLSGRDLRLALTLDGPFERPLVNYDLTARTLGYDKIAAEAVAAHGRSTREANGTVHIPVSLTVARLSGLSAAAGPLTGLSLAGPVEIRRNGAVAADLRLRADQLAAGLDLRGSQRTRAYAGTLQAKLGAPAVEKLGLGAVLGGAATLGADFARSRQVLLQVSNVRLAAPQLRVTGEGAWRADGRLSLAASADSPRYGQARLTAGGTLNALRAHLSAPSPKLPVPVTRVEADLAPAGAAGAYRLTASGASPRGPVAVDAVIRTRAPLTLTVDRAQAAGLSIAGTVTRSAQGPFTGALTLTGDGLDGALRLAGQGRIQTAAIDLRAAGANLPLAQPILIRSGRFDGRAVLHPGSPALDGRADLADVRSGGVTLRSLRVQASYQGGAGRASFAVAGDSGASFQLAGDAQMTPNAASLAAAGKVADVPLRLQSPARFVRQGKVWRLEPATLLTSDGRLVLAGTYGGGASLQAQLQNLDLGLVRAVEPDLEVSGRLSGQAAVSLPQGGAPSGRLSLQLANFVHTGVASVSVPIDVNLLVELGGAGGDARAVIRQRGAVLGRLQAHLAMPVAGAFPARLRAARISGGLRYDGPADALVSLAGVAGQQLTGPVAIGADISGPLEHPQMQGVVYGRNLAYENVKYGTHITGISADGRFSGERVELVKLTGSTNGGGKVSAQGYAELSAANGWPMSLQVKLDGAQLAQSDTLGAKLSGTLAITNSRPAGGLVSGNLTLDEASYQVSQQTTAAAAELKGVRWKGQAPQATTTAAVSAGPPSFWRLDVRVRAPNRILVNGMGLESEWRADLAVRGDSTHPRIVGDVRSVRGTYSFGGRRLTLADDSVVHFDGSDPPNPTLDISASATVTDVTATINVTGTANRPQIAFTSTPAMPEDEVLSELLFGGPSTQLTSLQALQLAASLNALRGGGGGLGALGKLSRATGLQNLRFEGANEKTGQGVSVGAGRYITNKVYVDVLTDARGYTATQIEVALTPVLSLLSQISTFGATSGSIRYTHRY